MLVSRSKQRTPADDAVTSEEQAGLRELVERLAFPRHFNAEAQANRQTGEYLADSFSQAGYRVAVDGPWRNVVAMPPYVDGPLLLVGAHYDSVPGSPGADDNCSAVAAMLSCARALVPDLPVCYVGFNREEDGLLGSKEFVDHGMARMNLKISGAHVLEMLGFTAEEQGVPEGLPIKLSDKGDFLGIVSAGKSNKFAKRAIRLANGGSLPVMALKTYFKLHKHLPVLHRSDHAPFWSADIPATMWTDTAEFRNPNYHHATDTPDTLDYAFLARVTRLLKAVIVDHADSG